MGGFVLLQIKATVITNWGSYYTLGQTLLQIRVAITNWGITVANITNSGFIWKQSHIFRPWFNNAKCNKSYCNLKENIIFDKKVNSKKICLYIWEVSNILICQKLQSVRSVQQKIKLPLPKESSVEKEN